MNLTNVPHQEQALKELAPLTAILYEFLPQAALGDVVPYFSERGRTINERAATDLLRYEVLWHLRQQGIDAKEFDEPADPDDEGSLHLRGLPNNGIEGTFVGWRFKILRSRNDAVPSPGRSAKRKAYYSQSQFEQSRMFPSEYRQSRPNVVILWDFDPTYQTVKVRLAVPRDVSASGTVSCYYNIHIPEPVRQILEASELKETDTRVEPNVQLKSHLKSEGGQTERQNAVRGEDKASTGDPRTDTEAIG